MQHFIKLFETLSAQEKSDYLFKILNKKQKLKNAFMEDFKDRLEKIRLNGYLSENIEDLLKEIGIKADELKDELDTLDFEETDWERWRAPSHYVPEWEAAHEVAEDEAMDIFKPYLFELEIALRSGNLIDIAKQYLVIFHGAKQCEINDPYNNFYDSPEGFFIDHANDLINSKIKELGKREFLNNDYLNTFDLIFRFYKEYYSEDYKLLEGISFLVIQLIKDKEIATFAWQKKEEHAIDLSLVPKLLNQIVSVIGDNKLWLKNMEECFLSDEETSLKLMDYYFENDKDKFESNAQKVYAHFNSTGEYLFDKINKGTKFHVELLKDLSKKRYNIKYFKELKKYLNHEQLVAFIDSVPPSDFKAKLLANEERFDDLVQLIKKECISDTSFYTSLNFADAISLIVETKPIDAWELTKQKIDKKMEGEKNRNTYSSVANMLKIARKIIGKEAEVGLFIKELYNHKPNLPALKEIFRSEGLV